MSEELIVRMRFLDQDGNRIKDKALTDAAMRVYNAAGDLLVNEIFVPCLNDIVYKDRSRPFSEEDQALYEKIIDEAVIAAYKFTACCGYGQVGSRLVYPVSIPKGVIGDDGIGDWTMTCNIEELWKEEGV